MFQFITTESEEGFTSTKQLKIRWKIYKDFDQPLLNVAEVQSYRYASIYCNMATVLVFLYFLFFFSMLMNLYHIGRNCNFMYLCSTWLEMFFSIIYNHNVFLGIYLSIMMQLSSKAPLLKYSLCF